MRISNKRARKNYEIMEKLEAGISLRGHEAKSIRLGRADISSAFVRIRDNEAYLVGANIPPYDADQRENYDPLRSRKLLLHKKEITSLSAKIKQKRLALIPLALYTKGPRVKVEIALARGRKRYEKREIKKKRDIERELERELRGKI